MAIQAVNEARDAREEIDAREEAFRKATGYTPELVPLIRDLGEGRYVMAKRLMFHWTVIVGHWDDLLGYDDRWCFENAGRAIAEVLKWSAEPDYEPTGWHRHPATGRRRPDGDPDREYIEG